ncbi:hypothetical protein ACET3X_007341 [Alternaria dauci]|uniref:BTB domain-containing protein n=1 Tax=Alternaria dauci TaxID=48095 RepID=A0ABR3UBQ6_9PLEO
MIQYCYQLDYTDQPAGSDLEVPEDVTLRSHVDVYMLAERYGVAGLKALALQKFEESAAKVLVVDGEEEQLLHAIRSMYASERRANADDLKIVAVRLCADHVQAFIHGTGKTMALVYESMDELPEFRADLFEEMATRWRQDILPCFSHIPKDDVVIFFDKGKQVMKIDKYLLCTESRFFAPMLDGPSVEGHIRCIRVRDDFPYAIAAMIQYMQEGNYTFNPTMRLEHANITLLDLHVHAYVVGKKYDVAKLCDHAIAEYLNIAGMILSMGIKPGEDPTDFSNYAVNGDHQGLDANPATSVLNSFLDSLVLIWRNTLSGDDALRQGVLELLKPHINQLMRLKFFQTLMLDLVDFGSDLVHSLAEDGFDIQAFPIAGGLQQKMCVKFGSAWEMA